MRNAFLFGREWPYHYKYYGRCLNVEIYNILKNFIISLTSLVEPSLWKINRCELRNSESKRWFNIPSFGLRSSSFGSFATNVLRRLTRPSLNQIKTTSSYEINVKIDDNKNTLVLHDTDLESLSTILDLMTLLLFSSSGLKSKFGING